jgi:hypothetical protein
VLLLFTSWKDTTGSVMPRDMGTVKGQARILTVLAMLHHLKQKGFDVQTASCFKATCDSLCVSAVLCD